MAESAAHAPGNEIRGEGGAIRQHQKMGRGEGVGGGGNFGVGPLPGTAIARNHGAHVAHDGMTHADHERAGPPAIDMGGDNMGATHHSHHGPHHHR